MNLHFMSICDALRRETDPERFWIVVSEALAHYGVTSLLYAAIGSKAEAMRPHPAHSAFIKSNHPAQYFQSFGNDTLLDDDWTFDFCLQKTDVLFWHTPDQWREASPQQIDRAKIERDLGLFKGVSVPASRFAPGLVGGMGLSMADVPLKDFSSHWNHCGIDILAICGVLDAGMRRGHLSSVIRLSAREEECLTWLAAGLRPEQIAERLGITRSTVDKYTVKARLKLKSGTMEQAIAKAILFNLIRP